MQEQETLCPLCGDSMPVPLGKKAGVGGEHEYNQCAACDLIYAVNIPTNEMFNEAYQGDYTVRSIRRKTIKLTPIVSYLKLRKRLRGDKNKLRFLDIGSNAGYFTEAARSLGCEAFGLELDEKAVEFAKANYPGSQFYTMSIEEFSKQDKKFDLIYCSEVIEHATDIHSFVKGIKAVSHEHTVLYLTTPDSGHFKVPTDLIAWKEVIPVHHLRLFNKNNLKTLLEQYGLKVTFSMPMLRANQRLVCRPIPEVDET